MTSEELKKRRKELGWSESKLANLLGVSRGTIVNYEKGSVIPETKRNILYSVLYNNKNDDNNLIKSNTGSIQVDRIVDVILENRDKFEKNKRFLDYIDGKNKDAVIAYQEKLLKEAPKK